MSLSPVPSLSMQRWAQLNRRSLWLAYLTAGYNLAEGGIAIGVDFSSGRLRSRRHATRVTAPRRCAMLCVSRRQASRSEDCARQG